MELDCKTNDVLAVIFHETFHVEVLVIDEFSVLFCRHSKKLT